MSAYIADLKFKDGDEQRCRRLIELRIELFGLANAFANEGKGDIGVNLHTSCNYILRALENLATNASES